MIKSYRVGGGLKYKILLLAQVLIRPLAFRANLDIGLGLGLGLDN